MKKVMNSINKNKINESKTKKMQQIHIHI